MHTLQSNGSVVAPVFLDSDICTHGSGSIHVNPISQHHVIHDLEPLVSETHWKIVVLEFRYL